MIGALAAVDVPPTLRPAPVDARQPEGRDTTYPLDSLRQALFDEDRIEVPVYPWPHTPADRAPRRRLLRVSAQMYNEAADYERLADSLAARI